MGGKGRAQGGGWLRAAGEKGSCIPTPALGRHNLPGHNPWVSSPCVQTPSPATGDSMVLALRPPGCPTAPPAEAQGVEGGR